MIAARRRPFLFPSVIAAYPALLVASGNVPEYSLGELAGVCALGLIAGAAVHLATAALWRRRASAAAVALAAAAANAWLFCGVHVLGRVVTLDGKWVTLTLAAAAATSVALTARFDRSPKVVRVVTRFAGIFSLALAATAVASIALGRARISRDYATSSAVRELRKPLPAATRQAPRPDVYLFILDNLANAEVMRRVYGVESDAFGDSLRALGFIVPPATRSNYSYTAQSVASLLNAGHVRDLEADLGAASQDRGVLFRLAQDNRVSRWFRHEGYAVYAQPSIGFEGTSRNASATDHFLPGGVTRLRHAIARSGLLRAYFEPTVPGRVIGRLGFDWVGGDIRLSPLRTVAAVATRPGPKFVVAHSLAAHDPLAFDSTCAVVSINEQRVAPDRDMYPRTARCTERLVLTAVRRILATSSSPPIIVLQADHGSLLLGAPFMSPAERITPEQARERMGAFGAYYLPGASLPAVVTPVNVFRYVLAYLGAPVEPVADSSYFASYASPYHFVNVTAYLAQESDSAVRSRPASY